MLIYQPIDGKIKVDVQFNQDIVWLSLDQMVILFGQNKSTISRHIKNIFEEGELPSNSVVTKFVTAASDGKEYQIDYYNLDAIISVGHRVKSLQGTQFHIWATQQLKEYLTKGFVLDDERLKRGSAYNYFRELLDRTREVRLSERLFYQQIKDIYATSIDYNPSDEMTIAFYKEVQNKLLWAVGGKTTAELIYYRSNAAPPMVGLTSMELEGRVRKGDITIGKNHLNEQEIKQLKLIVEQFLAYAEVQAQAEKPMYIRDWIQKLRLVLAMNDKNILEHAGAISHEMAVRKASKELQVYNTHQREMEHLESIEGPDYGIKCMSRLSHKEEQEICPTITVGLKSLNLLVETLVDRHMR